MQLRVCEIQNRRRYVDLFVCHEGARYDLRSWERMWARKLEPPDVRKKNGSLRKTKYALVKSRIASATDVQICWRRGVVYVTE